MELKHTRNCCQSALFRTSLPPHDGPGSHSPINSIPDNPLFQGRRSRKMYQESWIYFYMYVITPAPFSHDCIWNRISAVCEAEVELKTVPAIACLTVHGPCSIIYICWLIQFKWPSLYGNMVVATTKPKDGRMRRTGTWLAAINSLGPIVPRALQSAFGKRLSATSNAGNLRRHPGWSVFVLQTRRQHIMLCFSSLFTKVRSYKLEGC